MIGVGIDSVDIDRFGQVIQRRPHIIDRLFTSEEQQYCFKKAVPAASFAARFAVKEATMKALSVGISAFSFTDVSITTSLSGAPELIVDGKAKELADVMNVKLWKVSLTHTDTVATAIVIAL